MASDAGIRNNIAISTVTLPLHRLSRPRARAWLRKRQYSALLIILFRPKREPTDWSSCLRYVTMWIIVLYTWLSWMKQINVWFHACTSPLITTYRTVGFVGPDDRRILCIEHIVGFGKTSWLEQIKRCTRSTTVSFKFTDSNRRPALAGIQQSRLCVGI